MRALPNSARHQLGISYVEILAAVILIALTAVPAANALRGAMQSSEADALATVNHYRLVGRMDEVLATPFSNLVTQAAGTSTPTNYSDAAFSVDRRLVFISQYDGDNADTDNDPFTGTDPGLLWIRVEIENTVFAVHALKTDL